MSTFLNVLAGNENIVVLNDNYQYDASTSAQTTNAKWLDLTNVVSVKRDKTIYAIRARNSYSFNPNLSQTYYFANTTKAYTLIQNGNTLQYNSGVTFNSNIYANFGTSSLLPTQNQNFFMSGFSSVYGNLAPINTESGTASMQAIGICGSLRNTAFTYQTALSGNINISSNVVILGNSQDAVISQFNGLAFSSNISGNVLNFVPASAGNANINANGTCFQQISYSDWNRLINANIGGTVLINASTDPCDLYGNAVNNVLSSVNGNALTNEAFRHQFKLRANAQTASTNNPIYIARVSRFGTSLNDGVLNGNLSSKVSMHSFTSNFFASLPSDNQIYANTNLLTGIYLSGNITQPSQIVFNSNFTSGNLYTGTSQFNGNRTDNFLPAATNPLNNSKYLSIASIPGGPADYITGAGTILNANGDITSTGTFTEGDVLTFVQGNTYLTQGYLLMDRISFSNPPSSFVLASNTFSGNNNDPNDTGLTNVSNYANLWISANCYDNTTNSNQVSAKYITIVGSNIKANNWQSTPRITPNAIPTPSMIPFQGYIPGDTLNLYLRRGNVDFNNYSYVPNNPISPGVPYQPINVPSFITSMQWGANGDITLNSNVLENNNSMIIWANAVVPLPIVTGANTAISANVACNYQIVVSGNVKDQNRVNKAGNVVAGSNFANSFIGNAWCYNSSGVFSTNSGISSNVSIIYAGNSLINGVNIRGLDLRSADAETLPQYIVKFGNTVGSTNADSVLTTSNFTFFANVFANGVYNSNVAVQNPNVILNNNNHIANLLINDVAFSSYNLGTNSLKFTDISSILDTSNTTLSYNYYLPEAVTNGNTSTGQTSYSSSSDTFLNIITDYNIFNVLPDSSTTDVHEVTLYDFKYRYGISSIQSQSSQSSYIPKSIFINGNTFDPSTNFLINANQTGVNRVLTGNMEAPAISLYTYENVSGTTNYDTVYPFCLPNIAGYAPPGGTLFPCWNYNTALGVNTYTGNATSVNFKIPTNTNISQTISLKIHSQNNTGNGTPYMVATLTNGSQSQPATILITPVIHGKAPNGDLRYATPIVCGVTPNPASAYYTDYVVIMVELVSNTGGIVPELINSTTTIEILPTVNNNQQIKFNASLRSFPANSSIPIESTVVNNNWSFITPCFQLSTAFDGAPASNLQVEVYRQPSNQAIISYVYSTSVIKELMSYTRTDYALTTGTTSGYTALPSVTSFASSLKNINDSNQPDQINASLPMCPANSSRFYLDSSNSPVYVDVSNLNNTNQPLGILNVARSIEWTLYKDSALVGRGLISKNSSSTPDITNSTLNTYLVYENLPVLSSGFVLQINTNLTNLASRLLLQQITTNVQAQSANQWVIKTKADQLNLTVIRMSATATQTYYENTLSSSFIKNASLQLTTSNTNYDLGSALGGLVNANKFMSIAFKPVRGFAFNPSIFPTIQTNAIVNSVFTINIQPDSYAVVWVQPTQNATSGGTNVNGRNVLFSENNNVRGVDVNGDFNFEFANRTLAAQYSSTTNPSLSTTTFNLIANYVYMGYGQVSYVINDFQSNYNTPLNSLSLQPSVPRNPFGPQTTDLATYAAWQVGAASGTPTPVNVEYDTTRNKYYFKMGSTVGGYQDTIYFKGTGALNIPSYFNDKTTLLLYTGLRPLVLNSLTVINSTSTLNNVISAAGLFRWNPTDQNGQITVQNIFTSIASSDSVSNFGAALSKQLYQVVLTNQNTSNGFLFRSAQFSPSQAWYLPNQPNKNFFGSYVSSSEIFQNLTLNIERNTGLTSIPVVAQLDNAKYVNPQLSDDVLKTLAQSLTASLQYQNAQISYQIHGVGGRLFNFNIGGAINDTQQNFKLYINPSTMTVYVANDSNYNGEIDELSATNIPTLTVNGITSNFGLNNMFSELMFNLPPAIGLPFLPNNYRSPTPIASWQLNRNYNSIPGCPFDIQMNNMWAVGYNLDCVFALQNNNCVQFDVITVATKLTTNASGQVLSGLVVNNTAPLIVKNPTDWARSLIQANPVDQYNNGSKSGLAFKISSTNLIQAGSIVRLFVDNVINNNWLEWNVKTAALPASGKSFKINLYDQERYAALLDEQLNVVNAFI